MGFPITVQEPESRIKTIGASVTPTEEREILAAFDQAGLPNKSKAGRAVLLSFARSTKVRDAVAAFLRENMEILAA